MKNNDTITKVIDNEHCAKVENLSLTVFFYGHNEGVGNFNPNAECSHTHSYIEMFCCSANEGFVMTANGPIRLTKYDVVTVPAKYPHFAYSSIGGGAMISHGFLGKKIDVKCDYDLYGEFSDLFESGEVRIYRGAAEVCRRMELLKREAKQRRSPMPALEFMFVLRELKGQEHVVFNSESSLEFPADEKKRDISRFLLIEHIVSAYYTEPFDKDEIAKRLCVTRRHMDRIVKAHYGKTLRDLIYEKRILHSKRLLLSSDDSVATIAQQMGFSGCASFKSAFESATGMTPSEYRRKKN